MIIPQTKSIDTREGQTTNNLKHLEWKNAMHMTSVISLFWEYIHEYSEDVFTHDMDKFDANAEQMLKDFIACRVEKVNFRSTLWYKQHSRNSRHHILDHVKSDSTYINDVNLVDFIHMIADWVAAGFARGKDWNNDKVVARNVNTELLVILKKALSNTIRQMSDLVRVKEEFTNVEVQDVIK